MNGALVTVLTEAGSTVILIAFGFVVVRWLARKLDAAEARQERLSERMLRAWGLPPEEPATDDDA